MSFFTKLFSSLKFKIILSSAVCILVVGVFSNVFLYSYLSGIIIEKSDRIDTLNLETVQRQLDYNLNNLIVLGTQAANDIDIARAMQHQKLTTLAQKRDALRAQEIMRAYLAASNIDRYVANMVAFNLDENSDGISLQAVNKVTHVAGQLVRRLDLFTQLEQQNTPWVATIGKSLETGRDCFIYLSPIYNVTTSAYKGWLYVELDTAWLTDCIGLQTPDSMFVTTEKGRLFPQSGYLNLSDTVIPEGRGDIQVRQENVTYKFHSIPLLIGGLTLYNRSDVTFLARDGRPILFTVLVVVLTSLCVAFVLSFVLSGIITRPLAKLSARIQRIAENDFSRDPAIEQGGDEIARVGRMVNEMSVSIQHLLVETEELYQRRKNADIALLQSQVYPHFLYNTLDSIHWMAKIKKHPGIMKMTKSLSNLLKSLSKGTGDKISLHEELQLLEDYVAIQTMRYMQTFQFKNNVDKEFHGYQIIKFTLQPLVENAIFHGIEPTGAYGTITVQAQYEDGDLLLIVEDDGAGLTAEEISQMMKSSRNALNDGFSGVGVANVNDRLVLNYGKQYGLSYESEPGRYTRAIVRIPAETEATGAGTE
ncbi:histidine kinase [Ruminococcaceae bacterium OttesenSCG-928-A16]|nr:histidine kinase [Ruminococcaceae bacterium OttesenSCG-928-A16]